MPCCSCRGRPSPSAAPTHTPLLPATHRPALQLGRWASKAQGGAGAKAVQKPDLPGCAFAAPGVGSPPEYWTPPGQACFPCSGDAKGPGSTCYEAPKSGRFDARPCHARWQQALGFLNYTFTGGVPDPQAASLDYVCHQGCCACEILCTKNVRAKPPPAGQP